MISPIQKLVEANSYIGSTLGIVLNLYLLTLFFKVRDKNWRTFKLLLIVNSFLDILYSLVSILTQMVFIMNSSIVAVLPTGPIRNSPCISLLLAILYGNLTNTAFVFVPTTFLYRYLVIVRNVLLRLKHIVALLSVITLFQLPYTILSCLITPKEEDIEYVRDSLTTFFGDDQSNESIVYVGGRYNSSEFVAILVVVGVQVTLSYSCTIFCGLATFVHLRQHQHQMRAETKRLQNCLTKTLIAQALVPGVFCAVPIVMILIASGGQFNLDLLSIGFSLAFTWVSPFNALVVLYFMRPRSASHVMQTSTAQAYSQVPNGNSDCPLRQEEVVGDMLM